MTTKDAIFELIQYRRRLERDFTGEYQLDAEPFDMAIKALERQMPKKPWYETDKFNANLHYAYCPSCENWIGMWNSRLHGGDMYNKSNHKVCPYCGQMIDLVDYQLREYEEEDDEK